MSKEELQNSFVFIILGAAANYKEEDGGFNKFCNYSLFSNSVVISRLASLRGIPSKNIIIFAHGEASDYDMTQVPTTEVFFQLTIDEIYKDAKTIGNPTFPLNFQFFSEVEDIYDFLIPQVIAKDSHPNVLVFMDDHGYYEEFGHFDFFSFYQLFLTLKPQSLNIFADCCHSGTFIDVCRVFHYFKDLFGEGIGLQGELLISLLYNHSSISQKFSHTKLGGDIKSTFNSLLSFFASNQHLPIDEQTAFNQTIFNLCCSAFSDFPFVSENHLIKETFLKEITTLNLSGLSKSHRDIVERHFPTVGDLFDIGYFLHHNQQLCGKISQLYIHLLEKLNVCFPIFVKLENEFHLKAQAIFRLLSKMFKPNTFHPSVFTLSKPPNLFICTTSHPDSYVPTFGTRRITDQDKIIMGSPGMSAFIHEVLIFPHHDGISLDRLKALAQGTGTTIFQYAVSLPCHQKQWLSLDFRSYGACNSLPFLQLTTPSSAQAILNLIDFSLVVRFLGDHETPDDPNFPQDIEHRPKYCTTNYGFQISMKIDLNNGRKRYQPYDSSSLSDPELIYTRENNEDDDYYSATQSDDNMEEPRRGKKANNKNPVATIITNFPWNQKIPQIQLESYQFKRQKNYYYDLREVFFSNFETIKTDDYVINRNETRLINPYYENIVYDWLKCFLTTPQMMPYAQYIIRPITSYFVQAHISLRQFQEWFFISFNIADQVVTPYYFHHETFIKNRLDHPTPMPELF